MGRQSGDSTTKVSSSIALLQERFKQLQKVKARREEKELLKMMSSESEKVSPLGHFDPPNLPFQSNNMVFPHGHRPNTSQDQSLSLRLDLQAKQDDPCAMRKQPLTNLWSSASSSKSFDNYEIDTSLHL